MPVVWSVQRHHTASMTPQIVTNLLQVLPQRGDPAAAAIFADELVSACIFSEGEEHKAYFRRQVRASILEFMEEAFSAHRRILEMPIENLYRMGLSAVGITCSKGIKKGEVKCDNGQFYNGSDNRSITPGVTVGFSPYGADGVPSQETIECEVKMVTPLIVSPSQGGFQRLLSYQGQWRVDKLANRVSFLRQINAARVIASTGIKEGQVGVTKAEATTRPNEFLVAALIARGHTNQAGVSVEALCSSQVTQVHESIINSTLVSGLNDSQRAAVFAAMKRRITLIQGPPGTGKTATAIRILSLWVRLNVHGRYPVLATSDSNIAVDNLVEGCAAAGLKVVRLGRSEAIRADLAQFSIDNMIRDIGNLDAQNAHLEKMRIIRNAQVICATCIGVGSDLFQDHVFPAILMDEATQATEVSTIVSLCRSAQQVVLLGDQCQLPPTVTSRTMELEGRASKLHYQS